MNAETRQKLSDAAKRRWELSKESGATTLISKNGSTKPRVYAGKKWTPAQHRRFKATMAAKKRGQRETVQELVIRPLQRAAIQQTVHWCPKCGTHLDPVGVAMTYRHDERS